LSGVSGAGRKVELQYLFGECHESARAYGIPKHRHLSEIEEQLSRTAGETVVIQFSPHLIPIHRGILTTLYLAPAKPCGQEKEMEALREEIAGCYQAAYGAEPFVRLLDEKTLPDTKMVAGSNVIEIAWRLDGRTGRLLVLSAIDNITKGASGQAVQSMNILRGYPETAGLC
jgi:N-acetyl-gamma-glutamyl-phosphate reductase